MCHNQCDHKDIEHQLFINLIIFVTTDNHIYQIKNQ